MRDPLSITFNALAETSDVDAVDVLVAALDAGHPRIVDLAAEALLARSSVRGHVEVIRRLHGLGTPARERLEQRSARITGSLRQCLLHGDADVRRNALEVTQAFEIYELFRVLLELLVDGPPELMDETAAVVRNLVNRLYEHCRFDRDAKANRRFLHNAAHVRQQVLAALDQAASKIDAMQHGEEIIESIFILGEPDSFVVKRALAQMSVRFRELVNRLLLSNRHPGTMQFVLDSLAQNYPLRKVFEAIERRRDLEFICHLLRWLPQQLTEIQRKNLRQITAVGWLEEFEVVLQLIPGALQAAAVEFVSLVGISEEQKHRFHQWMIRHGSAEGRLAAAGTLSTVDEGSVREIIFDSLDSDDADVQAWATSQLRVKGIPAALSLLIERLDSPLEAVRTAARGELQSFNLECVLKIFEHLDPEICVRAGELIQKIHSNFIVELEQELKSPLRHRRVRAVRATQAMGLQGKVAHLLELLAKDEDALLRRIVAEMLGDVPALPSVELLQQLSEDPSRRVREAAVRSLEQLRQMGLYDVSAISSRPRQ